jgi:hypothetical protein
MPPYFTYLVCVLVSIPILTLIFKKMNFFGMSSTKSKITVSNDLVNDGVLNLDYYLSLVNKEITVVEDFEVKNGVLGLDRDVYLSIVKFLNSSTLRKV